MTPPTKLADAQAALARADSALAETRTRRPLIQRIIDEHRAIAASLTADTPHGRTEPMRTTIETRQVVVTVTDAKGRTVTDSTITEESKRLVHQFESIAEVRQMFGSMPPGVRTDASATLEGVVSDIRVNGPMWSATLTHRGSSIQIISSLTYGQHVMDGTTVKFTGHIITTPQGQLSLSAS